MNFKLHFVALVLAVGVIIALTALELLGSGPLPAFAAYGALHAICVLIGMRHPQGVLKMLLFVLAAATLNMCVVYLGMLAFKLAAALPGGFKLYVPLGACALFGALLYGLLLSFLWFPRLRPRRIAQIAIACLLASQLAVFATTFQIDFGQWWFVTVWWFTFSMGLWLADRRAHVLGAQSHP